MIAFRFLRPLRVPIAAAVRSPRFSNLDFFKTWIKLEAVNSQVPCKVTKSILKSVALQKLCQYAQKLRDSGCKFIVGNVVVRGFLGSVILWPSVSFCMDDFHPLTDYPQTISPASEKFDGIIALIRKLLVPFFLLLNLYLNWGQSHPIFLAAKVALVFLTTKPFPSSVYLIVDRFRRQIMTEQPFLYRFKQPQVKTVEVEDYTFLCLARVEIKDETLVLLGILGGWWILPLSSHTEVFLFDKSSWKELVSLVKSRLDWLRRYVDIEIKPVGRRESY